VDASMTTKLDITNPHTNTKITIFWMHNLNTMEKERKIASTAPLQTIL
jgi:hypothetical protein